MKTLKIQRQFIDENLAKAAKEAISWDDYNPNSSMGATVRYECHLSSFEDAVNEMLSKNSVDDETFSKVQYYADRYGVRLANAINDDNANTARCPSIMIAGGGNFPVHKKEKQMARAQSLWERDRYLFNTDRSNYYFAKIENLLSNKTIYSDDKDAVAKLSHKLAELETEHQKMVEANKLARKEKKEAPFPSYKLTNSNATIKRIRARIESLKAIATAEPEETAETDGITIIRDKEEMRLKLIFSDIPSEEIRMILKKNGFRWSPKNKAWQRLLNENSESALRRIYDSISK